MLSFAVHRLAATVPALALFAAAAVATAMLAGAGGFGGLGAALAALPVTVALVLPALALGSVAGALLGLTASLRPSGPVGALGGLLASAGAGLPAFLTAAILVTLWKDVSVLAAVPALALPPAAQAARRARGALNGALDGIWVAGPGGGAGGGPLLAARARGLRDRRILWGHAVPMALGPVAAGLRGSVMAAVAGAVAVETLFGLSGAGRLFVTAARTEDAAGAVAALAALFGLAMLLNALGAVLHAWVDPRARLA